MSSFRSPSWYASTQPLHIHTALCHEPFSSSPVITDKFLSLFGTTGKCVGERRDIPLLILRVWIYLVIVAP